MGAFRSRKSQMQDQDNNKSTIYKFECSVCGKQFKKSTNDSIQRPHRDKEGNECTCINSILIGTEDRKVILDDVK